jgi:hypothetical protein
VKLKSLDSEVVRQFVKSHQGDSVGPADCRVSTYSLAHIESMCAGDTKEPNMVLAPVLTVQAKLTFVTGAAVTQLFQLRFTPAAMAGGADTARTRPQRMSVFFIVASKGDDQRDRLMR